MVPQGPEGLPLQGGDGDNPSLPSAPEWWRQNLEGGRKVEEILVGSHPRQPAVDYVSSHSVVSGCPLLSSAAQQYPETGQWFHLQQTQPELLLAVDSAHPEGGPVNLQPHFDGHSGLAVAGHGSFHS